MEAAGDYYATLRVEPEAEGTAIRIAYRDLMRRYHPDVNRSDEAATTATAINEAYACLKDPQERAAYDRRRAGLSDVPARSDIPRPDHNFRRSQHSYMVDEEAEPRPAWWMPAGLGMATVLTVVLFAITSATPPPAPYVAAVVRSDLAGHRIRPADGSDCQRLRATGETICWTRPPAPSSPTVRPNST